MLNTNLRSCSYSGIGIDFYLVDERTGRERWEGRSSGTEELGTGGRRWVTSAQPEERADRGWGWAGVGRGGRGASDFGGIT